MQDAFHRRIEVRERIVDRHHDADPGGPGYNHSQFGTLLQKPA